MGLYIATKQSCLSALPWRAEVTRQLAGANLVLANEIDEKIHRILFVVKILQVLTV